MTSEQAGPDKMKGALLTWQVALLGSRDWACDPKEPRNGQDDSQQRH